MLKTYAHHVPSEDGVMKTTILRTLFSQAHKALEEMLPASREKALALTNLETAAMWAIKAVVINDPNSQVGP